MADVHLPDHWSKWTIIEEVGAGTYGTVYRVMRSDGSGDSSAVKIIHVPKDESEIGILSREFGSTEYVSKYFSDMVSDLVDEIQTLMSLKGCENIVQIEDYHVEKSKTIECGWDLYIRMEFLQCLSDYLQVNTIDEGMTIRMGIDLCKALEECEKVSIIHRDIKPDNILIAENGQFKLTDFGVAKKLTNSSSLTFSRKGTFSFMAPEVFHGRPYNQTADIYSLGLVLFRMLNRNRDPFISLDKQIIHYRDREEAMRKRMSGAVFPDPVQASPAMGRIIRKACAFLAKDRYQSAGQMRKALEDLQRPKRHTEVPPNQPKRPAPMNAMNPQVNLGFRPEIRNRTAQKPGINPRLPETGQDKRKDSLLPWLVGLGGMAGVGLLILIIALIVNNMDGNSPQATIPEDNIVSEATVQEEETDTEDRLVPTEEDTSVESESTWEEDTEYQAEEETAFENNDTVEEVVEGKVKKGKISIKNEAGKLVYKRSEIISDVNGEPAIRIYFDFTSLDEFSFRASSSFLINAFQNKVERDSEMDVESVTEDENMDKGVQKDATITVSKVFELDDRENDVTVQVGSGIGFEDVPNQQIVIGLK